MKGIYNYITNIIKMPARVSKENKKVEIMLIWYHTDQLLIEFMSFFIMIFGQCDIGSVFVTKLVCIWNLKWDKYMFNIWRKREREF